MKGVIDIGAHKFEEYNYWKSQGAEWFLLFEPVMRNIEYITTKYVNILCYNFALSNWTGETEMYIDSAHDNLSASILDPAGHRELYPGIKFDRKERVRVATLDSFIYDREDYDFMYITAGGTELNVLKGAEKSLDYIKTIETQVYRKPLFKDSFLIDDMTRYLNDKGFELFEVVNRDSNWGHAIYKR